MDWRFINNLKFWLSCGLQEFCGYSHGWVRAADWVHLEDLTLKMWFIHLTICIYLVPADLVCFVHPHMTYFYRQLTQSVSAYKNWSIQWCEQSSHYLRHFVKGYLLKDLKSKLLEVKRFLIYLQEYSSIGIAQSIDAAAEALCPQVQPLVRLS